MTSVFLLGEERDVVTCRGCDSSAPLLDENGGEPPIAYALNTLLDRAMDQDVVPHLLALHALERDQSVVWGFPGADVVHQNGRKREVDLIAVSREGLFAGEMKPAPRVTPDVIRDSCELAAALGAATVVFGTLSSWTQNQRDEIATVAGDVGIAARLLDEGDLRN